MFPENALEKAIQMKLGIKINKKSTTFGLKKLNQYIFWKFFWGGGRNAQKMASKIINIPIVMQITKKKTDRYLIAAFVAKNVITVIDKVALLKTNLATREKLIV